MKVFSTSQIKEIDRYTILNEPVSSSGLMERAANECTSWITANFPSNASFVVFAGPGNNGGDGLAIARQLFEKNYLNVKSYILDTGSPFSVDMEANLTSLSSATSIEPEMIKAGIEFPILDRNAVVIDALFGSGLSRPLSGQASSLVYHINNSGCRIISIDIPSGLFGEDNTENNGCVIKAACTLTFQFPKRSFFYRENSSYTGSWHILDINLNPVALNETHTDFYYLTPEDIKSRIIKRERFSHKGTFGNALLVAGSYGMTGAAILSARACYASGAGLVTCHVPAGCYPIVQTAVPEVVFSIDRSDSIFTDKEDITGYSAVGIGPGLGTNQATADAFEDFIERISQPAVIDADALNIISSRKHILNKLKPGSVLTPHPKEFDRIFGECKSGYSRNMTQIEMAVKYGIIIVLKGAFTSISMPDGRCFFNSTGNPGMATAGSGDVLTGIILALLSQGYSPADAAIAGPWIHGLAGDIAAEQCGQTALTASVIIDNLGNAFKKIERNE